MVVVVVVVGGGGGGGRARVSLAGLSCHKYDFCRDKGFVATNTCMSRQRWVCHDKTRLLS